MDQELLKFYDRELNILYDQGEEFSKQYPGKAKLLGLLLREHSDPMVAGLLQGVAFLAARVQLKLAHEFPEFTSQLIEQLVPHYLAPIPSVMMAKITPPFNDDLSKGRLIAAGSHVEASYYEFDKRITCDYRMCTDTMLWPLELRDAKYHPTAAAVQNFGVNIDVQGVAALVLSLTCRHAPDVSLETTQTGKGLLSKLAIKQLPIHLVGSQAQALRLYEQIMSRCVKVYVRSPNEFGDAVLYELPQACINPLGLGEDESIFPFDTRLFQGFERIRDYFLFPRVFLGFSISGLETVLPRVYGHNIELILVFKESHPDIAASTQCSSFALYTNPAINLFEKTTDRMGINTSQHDYHIVPDRGRPLDYEAHRLLNVFAHFSGGTRKTPILPLYSEDNNSEQATKEAPFFYTISRTKRRRSVEEREDDAYFQYMGTEMYLMVSEKPGSDKLKDVSEMSARVLCSNRHLTQRLVDAVGQGKAEFNFVHDTELNVSCIAGPTRPREPIASPKIHENDQGSAGTVSWRLVNLLNLNHTGLIANKEGHALHDALSLFADMSDISVKKSIKGIRKVESAPVIRRVSHRAGLGVARGTQITITLEELAFENASAFLMGTILDRLFADYASINHFTQTVICTLERGEIIRFPPRIGAGKLI